MKLSKALFLTVASTSILTQCDRIQPEAPQKTQEEAPANTPNNAPVEKPAEQSKQMPSQPAQQPPTEAPAKPTDSPQTKAPIAKELNRRSNVKPVTAAEIGEINTKYEALLLLQESDYKDIKATATVYSNSLRRSFQNAVESLEKFSYKYEDQPASIDFKKHAETELSAEKEAEYKANKQLENLFSSILPTVAYAYLTPGPKNSPNPYYKNPEVLKLYTKGLEFTYSRGLTEDAWLIDHNGHGSARAMAAGFKRKAGDFSTAALNLGGFIQSIYLMRHELQQLGLLKKYQAVVKNLVINHGEMYETFFDHARESTGVRYDNTVEEGQKYFLNADGIRLFVDYFTPYYLMIEDDQERQEMTQILGNVLRKNIAIQPGTQDTIKPDGTGYHHQNAYVAGYSPFAFEVDAQSLYVLSTLSLIDQENIAALKLALEKFRVMAQKYSVSTSLRGRLIGGKSIGSAIAINKAIAFLAHPDGLNDPEMQARFSEYFDASFFYNDENIGDFYRGKRGVPIRGLGIFRLIDEVESLKIKAAAIPQGTFVQPYANAAFFRKGDWLVTAKGFSTYLWDYEGPLNKQQNTFGQNWSYGLLEVFSAGVPTSSQDSGYDLNNGWDWYHVPGTTASHYPIEKRSKKKVVSLRKKLGIDRKELHRSYNSKTFVGGASIGEHGIFAIDLEAVPFTSKTDLTARKTYFFVGDKVLAMGRNISGGTKEDETHTTLFQTALQSPKQATHFAGDSLKALCGDQSSDKYPVAMTDSAGNSYLLTESSSEMTLRRSTQQSMDQRYKLTEGDYVSGFINHGIKPKNESYTYVIVPNDPKQSQLKKLERNPSSFFTILSDDDAHVAIFPEHKLTGFAFYEANAQSPKNTVVKTTNYPSTVVTQQLGQSLDLAVSVPDLGWEIERNLPFVTLGYASSKLATQEAKEHKLKLTLRGKWKLTSPQIDGLIVNTRGSETHLTIPCKDGLSQRLQFEKSR